MQILQFVGIMLLYAYHYIAYLYNAIFSSEVLRRLFKIKNQTFPPIRLPMITYPDCQACECGNQTIEQPVGDEAVQSTFLTPISDPTRYYDKILSLISVNPYNPLPITSDLNTYALTDINDNILS